MKEMGSRLVKSNHVSVCRFVCKLVLFSNSTLNALCFVFPELSISDDSSLSDAAAMDDGKISR